MKNPWLKKNPFMSVWLSGANSVAGSMRGHAAAHVKRQAATATTQATRGWLDLWAQALQAPAPPARKKRR